MRTASKTNKKLVDLVPDLLLTRHPTVQAFVDKKVEQARESLKDADLSVILRNRKGN
ncbi:MULTISPECIES: hypothetical protein [Spirosoma]|uniref:hypothetical protein n=1 Tax=Spirosoma TaxID=107 RepID=UPI0013747482|nr:MULTISPECIES: hypothetical protein [Spirosoma]